MIKNIIFDLGGVIFDYNPKKYVKKFGYNEEIANFLTKEIFFGPEWLELASKATGTFKEIKEDMKERLPNYSMQIDELESGNWKLEE